MCPATRDCSENHEGIDENPSLLVDAFVLGSTRWGSSPGCSDAETPGATATDLNGVLAPPASLEEGWQFTNGPFSVHAGQERQICYFVEVPYDTETFFNRINATHATGSHHMNIFRVKTVEGVGRKRRRRRRGWRVLEERQLVGLAAGHQQPDRIRGDRLDIARRRRAQVRSARDVDGAEPLRQRDHPKNARCR